MPVFKVQYYDQHGNSKDNGFNHSVEASTIIEAAQKNSEFVLTTKERPRLYLRVVVRELNKLDEYHNFWEAE